MEWYEILCIVIGSLAIYSILIGACMAAMQNLGLSKEKDFDDPADFIFICIFLPLMLLVVLGVWVHNMLVNKK